MTIPGCDVPAEILGQFGLYANGPGPAIVTAPQRGAVLWANDPARRLLGSDDLDSLGTLLFGSGSAGRSLAARLARLGPALRLERLALPGLWSATPPVAACMAVASPAGEPLVVMGLDGQLVRAGHAALTEITPRLPALTPPLSGDPATETIRILWDTDREGLVTHMSHEAGRVPELAVFAVGDRVVERLRLEAPALADLVDAVLRDGGSVRLSRFDWPSRGSGRISLDLGCTTRPGLGGLRGFLLVHAPVTRPASTEVLIPEPDDVRPDDHAPPRSLDAGDPVAARPADVVPLAALEDERTADVTPSGNIVHFPTLRAQAVPAKFATELKSAPKLEPPAPLAEADVPRWSESPGSHVDAALDELTADEQDAFAHIAKVLGTRSFATGSSGTESTVAASAASPLSDDAGRIVAALPIAALLRRGEHITVNAALLSRLGEESADSFLKRLDGRDPTEPGNLTRADGSTVLAEVSDVDLGDVPARLLVLPSEDSNNRASARDPAHFSIEALDAVTDGTLWLDRAGTITAVSARAAACLGRAADALVGRAMADLFGQGAGWTRRTIGSPVRSEATLQMPDGTAMRVTIGAVPHEMGFLCVLSGGRPLQPPADASETARREAERTSALKSEFLAKVSHEIRTPLNAILGFAEVIRDERLGPVGNARYLEYIRDIHASGTHVMSLVNDLLDLSRIEAGRMDLRLEPVDANAVVQSCVNTLQTQAHRERIIVRLSLAPHLPATLADERSLRQIVLNLLSNAVKFNEPGGQVIVSTALVGKDAVAVRIRDTGIGMTDEDIAAAMEPFRQISTVNRTGSGLGLPLTKALVEANCATMAIKSSRGEGTLVEVTFPIVEPETVSLPA